MCGIVGYVGSKIANDFLIEGLRRLEYRGYDSAGTATLNGSGEIEIIKSVGRISGLASKITKQPSSATLGIGHTRWATHGVPNEANAHPHIGGRLDLAIVHNGVIENHAELKQMLQERGFVFGSDTDTEVIGHLIAEALQEELENNDSQDPLAAPAEAIRRAIKMLRGTYGLAVVFKDHPDAIFAVRLGSPLVIGIGQNENFLASDAAPLAGFTDKIVYLADHQLAIITENDLRISHRDLGQISPDVKELAIDSEQVELGDFDHYMLKEIYEQPEALANTMRGRLSDDDATAVFGGLNLTPHH